MLSAHCRMFFFRQLVVELSLLYRRAAPIALVTLPTRMEMVYSALTGPKAPPPRPLRTGSADPPHDTYARPAIYTASDQRNDSMGGRRYLRMASSVRLAPFVISFCSNS